MSRGAKQFTVSLLVAVAIATTIVPLPAQADPQGTVGFRVMEYARGLNKPTSMGFAPDGRLFVTQKEGSLRVISTAGELLETPALTLVVDAYRERGLLSVEFDPDFATNGYFFLYYTSGVGGCHNQVSRFTMVGDVADPGSELQLINIGPCGSGGHNGGALHLSQDRKLLIQVGEQNIGSNAQILDNLFGKILRINRDGSIPTDNPFYSVAAGRNRSIWAYGFRNPFSGGVDPVTGDHFVNDVGHMSWEEINWVQGGENHGWPTTEGDFNQAEHPDFTRPVHAYPHGPGVFEGCAIVGGTFYRSNTGGYPAEYDGDWFFADYCGGDMRVLDRATGTVSSFATGTDVVVDLDVGPDGNVYALDRTGGPLLSFIRKFEYSPFPGISKQPTAVVAEEGTVANFRVVPSGEGPFNPQWFRNDVAVSGATSRSIDVPATAANDGARYKVRLTNGAGSIVSKEVTLDVVTAGNTPPRAGIGAPTDGSPYNGRQDIAFWGTGTDDEDGTLGASQFTWEVEFRHADHVHPFLEPFGGVTSGTFRIPDDDETATDVFYRIHLTVIDSLGAPSSTYVDVLPNLRDITISTLPGNFTVLRNGEPTVTPVTFASVVGVKQPVEALATVDYAGTTWSYDTWFDTHLRSRRIVTGAANRHYRVNYHVAGGAIGTGNGLLGTYYDNVDFTGLTRTRNDRLVSFAWRRGVPHKDIEPSSYSVRWTGTLTGQFSENYTFHIPTRNGVRLLVDGLPVIDAPANASFAELSGTKTLVAGQRYDVELQLTVPGDVSVVRLEWSGPSTPRSLVPMSQLSH